MKGINSKQNVEKSQKTHTQNSSKSTDKEEPINSPTVDDRNSIRKTKREENNRSNENVKAKPINHLQKRVEENIARKLK